MIFVRKLLFAVSDIYIQTGRDRKWFMYHCLIFFQFSQYMYVHSIARNMLA